MKVCIPLYNGAQIECDSQDEANALVWMTKVTPYSIEECFSLWEYFDKKYPKNGWEDILKRTAAILHLCSASGQGVSTILEQMMKADMLGKPWPI